MRGDQRLGVRGAMTSWGAYRTPAAFRAPMRDAANRLRSWILSKRRLWDSELRRAEWERDYALKRIEGLLRQLEIEKDRREGIAQDLERAQFTISRLDRDREQFESQVLNRERNVAVKEQQLQGLEQQIEKAYASGVRDGKFELEELRRMGREPSRGDRIAAEWSVELERRAKELLAMADDRAQQELIIKPRAVEPRPEAHEYQGPPRVPPIIKPSLQDVPREPERNSFEEAVRRSAELDQKQYELEHGGPPCKVSYEPKEDEKNGRGPTET